MSPRVRPKVVPFVWEVGCEEIPAGWLPATIEEFRARFAREIADACLEAPVEGYGTPRRLVVHVPRLPASQPDRTEQIVGPPAAIARTPDGDWSPAALGFAKKKDIAVGDLKILKTDKGEYAGAVRHVKGRPARDLLPGMMAAALRGLTFPKFMNWDAEIEDGRGAFPFGRPIRWVVALLDGKVVPFTVRVLGAAGVAAGNRTRGHRFLAPRGRKPGASFAVASFKELKDGLKRHFVILDPAERRARLLRELEKIEKKAGARRAPGLDPDFVADLVEWPGVVMGRYPEEFAALPQEIRHTVLIHHQKYFPLRGQAAYLAPTNMPSDPKGHMRRGSERVVVARLRDADFFWKADLEKPLGDRLAVLDRVQFHERLGSYREKVERLARLATFLAEKSGVPIEEVRRAAELAKCDLTTQMVGEFAELQGVVGGLYAREQNEPEAVWKAVYSHYRPQTLEEEDDFPFNAAGAVVSLADKLDTLAGLFSAGVVPTGSKDPFGLRRTALGVLRLLLQSEERLGLRLDLTLSQLLSEAARAFGAEPGEALTEFVVERLRFALERQFRYDEVEAVLANGSLDRPPADLARRLEAVRSLRGSEDFAALSVAFKRVRNILAGQERRPLDPSLLAEPEEKKLSAAFYAVEPEADELVRAGRYAEALRVLSRLRPEVDAFFDKVLVMSPHEQVRRNRLALLHALQDAFTRVADLSEIVPGTEED